MLLEQTKGKGVNIYTHGEMLPCHGYEGLKNILILWEISEGHGRISKSSLTTFRLYPDDDKLSDARGKVTKTVFTARTWSAWKV